MTVALGEYDTGWHDAAASLERARRIARGAAAAGATLLVLPEMCLTGFTMEADAFADSDDGESITALSRLATDNRLWLVAGSPIRRNGKFVNAALAFSPTGERVASYEKQKLFGYARENEIYSPGTEPRLIDIEGVRTALFICFDLRFPELFREVGPRADAFILIANWPAARQSHWDVLTRARAIENQCYMIAVNRIGEGGGLSYVGGSAVYDPWGERCDRPVGGALRIAEVSRGTVEKTRESFPLSAQVAPTSLRAR